jgi:sugar (pentulose or hexulose) kinase
MAEIVDLAAAAHRKDPADVLPVDGGLSRSDIFCQILADALARPVQRLAQPEATAWGAAQAAAQGLGATDHGPPALGQCFFPNLDPPTAAQRLVVWQTQALNLSPNGDAHE